MAFLQACRRHQLRGGTVALYRVSVPKSFPAAEISAKMPGQSIRVQMFRVSWAEEPIPRIAVGTDNAAYRYVQRRAFSLGKPGRQGHPVNGIYLAYRNGK